MPDWTRTELEKKLANIKVAVTIPVNVKIEGKQRILDLSEMQKILSEAKTISLSNCACREKVHGCDAPLDVCFSLNQVAEDFVEKGWARKVNLEDALDALKRSHEAGLVHVTFTHEGKEKPDTICSCCSCCCHSLAGLIRFGMPDAIVASKYVAAFNPEICTSCGKCVSRCQFKARWMENGILQFDRARCFGCGVCVSTCPTGAISLVTRTQQQKQMRNAAIV